MATSTSGQDVGASRALDSSATATMSGKSGEPTAAVDNTDDKIGSNRGRPPWRVLIPFVSIGDPSPEPTAAK